MIVFDLVCTDGHRFEGWFASGEEFALQNSRRLVSCPICGAEGVARLPSAPRFNLGAPQPAATQPAQPASDAKPRDPFAIAQLLYSRMLDELLTKTEDVGDAFAVEARKIHYDEAPARPIRGRATALEHEEMVEEGLPVVRFPLPPSDRFN